jgi:phytol kinase
MAEWLPKEISYTLITTGVILVGIWLSNVLYDQNVPHYMSRKIGHGTGGLAFLSSVFLFSSALLPIILTTLFGFLLWGARFVKPNTFRGIGSSGHSPTVMTEVWFVWVAVPVLAIGWLWLAQPWATVACLLFMAWGDAVTGLVRSQIYHKPVKGLWGSLAMLLTCLPIAWAFISPFWIGAVASVVATATEWAFGNTGIIKWGDDNWAIPLTSLGTVMGLFAFTGNLATMSSI